MTDRRRWSAVIPTLGTSIHLEACVDALRADGGDGVEIVVVAQPSRLGVHTLPRLTRELAPRVDRWLELPANRGFTGGTNAGIRASTAPWVATVNDDAVVRPGWSEALLETLESDPGGAAAQGVNLQMGDPRQRIDGFGLGWNRWWQAVQLGRGRERAALERELAAEPGGTEGGRREVFGVSATAAIYRREALERVGAFDERLVSWYEDAELAVRLRRDGWRAWSVPAALADHAGGTTGGRRPVRYGALLYGNRWLVVARLLGGRRFRRAVPRLLARDLRDLARRPSLAPAVLLGWLRAARYLRLYLSPHGAPSSDG